jgi:hypothetical protein
MIFMLEVSLEKSFNATFNALILKKLEAVDVEDFRPISLVSWVYKIIVKVLMNRVKRVVDKIILMPQNASTRGRHSNFVLIANECLGRG